MVSLPKIKKNTKISVMEKTLIVIPCYNESNRLNINEFIKRSSDNVGFLFADDGSSDSTAQLIEDAANSNKSIYSFIASENKGKGAVIRDSLLNAKDSGLLDNFEWFGFFDADLATPLFEIQNMFEYKNLYDDKVDVILGSRIYRLGANIIRSSMRHYLGRGFATVISIVLKIDTYDSQCGAKLFRAELLDKCFKEEFISKWIFDVEILLRLEQKNVIEYPLRSWEDIPGSKLKIGKEIFRVLADIYKIWKKHY